MKAFLIDPFQRDISVVETGGSLDHLRWLIGADLLCTARFDHQHDLWLDDSGLMVPGCSETMEDVQRYFILYGLNTVSLLAGRAVLLGRTEAGDTVEPDVTLEVVQARIAWPKDQHEASELAEALCKSVAVIANAEELAAAAERDALLSRRIAALAVDRAADDGQR